MTYIWTNGLYLGEMIVFGQNGFIWSYWVVFGQTDCIWSMWATFDRNGCTWPEWVDLAKWVVFGTNSCMSLTKWFVLCQNGLYFTEMVVFRPVARFFHGGEGGCTSRSGTK